MFRNPVHWRLRKQRYRLAGRVCSSCGKPVFPPRLMCGSCEDRQRITDPARLYCIRLPKLLSDMG
ncbi:MAG: hypothetical protein B6D39_12035 [Anaerolineae bacterium UTCFX2]|nr:MAG: hypothetical protein B6D39_12035 [Anaerolineae bacterium UTCFX2]